MDSDRREKSSMAAKAFTTTFVTAALALVALGIIGLWHDIGWRGLAGEVPMTL